MPPDSASASAHSPRPTSRLEFLNALRGALAQAPKPLPEVPGVPLLGRLGRLHRLRCGPLLRAGAGAQSRCHRDAARALRSAALAAGVRSPDPHRGAAARWQRGRSPKSAPRGDQGAARRGARHTRAGALFSRHAFIDRGGARTARAARAGIHRFRRCVSAGAGVALRGPPCARAVRGVPGAAAAQSFARTCISASWATSRSWALHPRRWSSATAATRNCGRSRARVRAAPMLPAMRHWKPSCWRIPRKMPST